MLNFLLMALIVPSLLIANVTKLTLIRGETITAPVVFEQAEAVYLDLGFTLIKVPRTSIASITELELEPSQSIGDAFYDETPKTAISTVDALARELGKAVVLIRTSIGLGSGFIINEEGYVVTNNHVISGEHKISVTVFDQTDSELRKNIFKSVRIVATNPSLDLALLKIESEETFPFLPVGKAADIKQGQPVFAIGSPLGLERSVSQGIISNAKRPFDGLVYLQSTAEISPGNSGGPLFNLKGQVIGVNNMKVIGMGAEGLGFAIPAEIMKFFLDNREAFAFDPRNPNSGFRYYDPVSK